MIRLHVVHMATNEGVKAQLTRMEGDEEKGYYHRGSISVTREQRWGGEMQPVTFNWSSSSSSSSFEEAQDHAKMMQHAITIGHTFASPLYDAPRHDVVGEDRSYVVLAEYDL